MTWKIDYPRTVAARRPAGHVPRAPRWTLEYDAPTSLLTSDYLAVQVPDLESPAARRLLELARAAQPHGPEAAELLVEERPDGVDLIVLGYWKDATEHARWRALSPIMRWFDDLDPAAIDFGAWHEVVQVPMDRAETIYSDPRHAFGIAATPGTRRASMTTNGYFGAARDRFWVSAIDRLEPAAAPVRREVDGTGRRLRAECGHNTAVIRSGQHWREAEGEQLADYEDSLEPKMLAGMQHLRDHPEAEGTLSLRILRSLDPQTLAPLRETSVLGHFNDLALLEGWAASHQTHTAIYEHAVAKNRQYGDERTVVTWHEVFIVPRSAAFEYVNCRRGTGLLERAHSVMEVV